VVQDEVRQKIRDAFMGVDGRGALLVIADTTGVRAHVAANLNGTWKVAAGGGVNWKGKVTGEVMLMGVW
jgi:hypothetical protein